MSQYQKAVKDARHLMRSHTNAILSTLSLEMDGWPFGSVAPYILDYEGCPILFLSDLAQHSHNMQKDDRASLIVWEQDKEDIQQAGRVTVLGRATEIEGTNALRDRYLRYLPQAQQYFAIHDFRFYRLSVERLRFIGGFGDIHWIRGEDYRLSPQSFDPILAEAESGAVVHMNADHQNALVQYCRAHGVEEPEPRLLGIDPEGFDVQARGRRLRMDFDAPVRDAKSLREAFVRLSQSLDATRDKLPGSGAG
ncbi:MAG: HugZ family pyridoxamine 5'-phosphate oxidase [Acidiferrobacter sp.]